MPAVPNPDGKPLGPLLKAHRIMLGVTDEMMIEQGGQGLWWELKWTQNAQKPSELRVRQYYVVVRDVIEHMGRPPEVPACQLEQWYSTDADTKLHERAIGNDRRVAWWWGVRRTARGAGAQCYVCNALIHAYDIGRGMTHPARVSVMHHRADHINEMTAAGKRPGENKVTS